MSTLVLSSAILLGYEATTFIIRNRLKFHVRLSIGVVLGMTVQSFSFFVTSLFFTFTRQHCIFVALIYYILALILYFWNRKFHPSLIIDFTCMELIVNTPCILFILWGCYVVNISGGNQTRGPAYADLPFHMNIISSFTVGINRNRRSLFDVWSCFQADIRLAYPMFHNFYIACLICCQDISMTRALQATAYLLSLSMAILLIEVSLIFTNNRMVTLFTLPTWLLLGGLGWTMIFYPQYTNNKQCNWILRFGNNIHATWMQSFAQFLLPQRSALFSMPLCLACLICFMKGTKEFQIQFFILAGLCTGFLPQLQMHSFVALAQFAVATCLIFFPSKQIFWKAFVSWFVYGLISCSIGLPLTYPFWIRRAENELEFIRFKTFWADNIYGKLRFPLFSVWWKSLGPFAMIMFFMGWISATSFQIKIWLSAMIVWLITMFVRYQPWSMDNLKLINAVWLPIAIPYVNQFYIYVFKRSKMLIKFIVFFLMIQNCFSSILCFKNELFKPLLFMSDSDIECGKWINENTPVNSIFMSYSSRFNPATALAGRQLYLGFISWVAQHGISRTRREQITTNLLKNTSDYGSYAKEGIGFVLVKKHEDLIFKVPKQDTAWSLVYEDTRYKIYRLVQKNISIKEHMRDNDYKSQDVKIKTPLISRTQYNYNIEK